jgi:hypothetical protein
VSRTLPRDASVGITMRGVGWLACRTKPRNGTESSVAPVHQDRTKQRPASRPSPIPTSAPGGTVSFTAAANGTPPFTYQWRRNGVPIDTALNPSAATATLTITNVRAKDVASYDCVIDGPCEPATTAPATLALCPADLDCNTLVDDEDFQIFVAAYNILDCADPSMPAGCPSDLNADAIVDDLDFQVFVLAYKALVCE